MTTFDDTPHATDRAATADEMSVYRSISARYFLDAALLPASSSSSPYTFGGFAFSSALRVQSLPNFSTFSMTGGGTNSTRRSSFSSGVFLGLPRPRFGSSMG